MGHHFYRHAAMAIACFCSSAFADLVQDMKQKALEIEKCAQKLATFAISHEDLVSYEGGITDIMPLNMEGTRFEASFDFFIYQATDQIATLEKKAQAWVDNCADKAITQNGEKFSALFSESLEKVNKDLFNRNMNVAIYKEMGYNNKLKLCFGDLIPIGGSYTLGETEIFRSIGEELGHYMCINLKDKNVELANSCSSKKFEYKGTNNFSSVGDLKEKWTWFSFEKYKDKALRKLNSEDGLRKNSIGSKSSVGNDLAGFAGLFGCGIGLATKALGNVTIPKADEIDINSDSPRSAASIMKTVKHRAPGLRGIYVRYLKKKPGFKGKVTYSLSINPNGKVTSISIISSTFNNADFEEDIKSAISRWSFNAVANGTTTITIPFKFTE